MRRDFGVAAPGGTAGGRGVAVGPTAPAVAGQMTPGAAGQATPGASGQALAADPTGIYSLRGIYFNQRQFDSTADCLTAASARGLPLDLCR